MPAAVGERLAFTLPPELEATEPPEARGVARDGVRLLVARSAEAIEHSTFSRLPSFLDPGDLLVVNTSATLPAALDAVDATGTPLVVHLSTRLDDGRWVVEPRRPDGSTTSRWDAAAPPASPLALAGGGTLVLDEPYRGDRLWVATLRLERSVRDHLAAHGRPIRYRYVAEPWPIDAYQNVYATEPGSAEMPSAGRPITADLVTRLVASGVGVVPVVLHTGVASLEADELPYPERARVPAATAAAVNLARARGGRVVAVGTTVVRALETAAGADGTVAAFDGWTDVVVTPGRGVRAVDGLVTGWHEPEASHLLLLEAVAGRETLERAYAAALDERYLWHEFGDSCLLLAR
jgi:S-adenosylmethionine:tRNA ribosyltransferase-isomerase